MPQKKIEPITIDKKTDKILQYVLKKYAKAWKALAVVNTLVEERKE